MITTTETELQFDHKHWLQDLRRWRSYLRVWKNQVEEISREYRKLLKDVGQHADDLEEFEEDMQSHFNRLVVDEFSSLTHRDPDQLAESHAVNAARHDELYKFHERLKQIQHTLLAGLAVLKDQAWRDE